MINPYSFTKENLKTGFKIDLDSHNINLAIFILTMEPSFVEFRIEFRYINKISKEMATIYARILNHYKFRYHVLFSASYCKTNVEDQRSDETDLFINLNFNHNLTETDIDNIDVKSQLEHHIQIQETKESGWSFDQTNSMKIFFIKLVN